MRRLLAPFSSILLLGPSSAVAFAGEAVKVSISDLAFNPADVTVHVGDTVEWGNADFIDHTATATSGDWDVEIFAGKNGHVQLTKAGTLGYFCRYHPTMKGTIHVVADR